MNITSAIDHFCGRVIKYPITLPAHFKYDFLFRKGPDDQWRYMNSSNQLDRFRGVIESTQLGGGEYAIIEAKTGKIADTNVSGH